MLQLTIENTNCNCPAIAANCIQAILQSYDEFEKEKEHFFIIGVNNKNNIIYIDLVSIGTVSETIVHPREVFRYAILKGVSGILIAHNHPSGDLMPSKEDLQTTRRLVECGKILGITILDHIICTHKTNCFTSLKEESYI